MCVCELSWKAENQKNSNETFLKGSFFLLMSKANRKTLKLPNAVDDNINRRIAY